MKKSKGRLKKFEKENNILEFTQRPTDEPSDFEDERDRWEDETFRENESYSPEEDFGVDYESSYTDDEEHTAQRPHAVERKKKRHSRKRRRRRLIYLTVFLLFAVTVGFAVRNIVVLKLEQNELRAKQEELQQEKKDLEQELSRVGDQDYIEQQARKQLHMVKPGEIMYVFPDEEE